jgi:protein involved in plasmid replication-relaxation
MGFSKPHLLRQMALATRTSLAILADSVHAPHYLPQLRFRALAPQRMEMRLWLHIRRAPPSAVSNLQKLAPHGAVFRLRCNGEAARTMRLTTRCIELFRLLHGARWLATRQIHRRFFPNATLDATRKRLRKFATADYLVAYRAHRMAEALYTLGREGKRVLEQAGAREIRLERKPPKQLEHFSAVNDIRIAAELTDSLSFFFAYWELPALGWRDTIIPDAVCSFASKTFAIEFDRGLEGVKFFLRTKVAVYERGLADFPTTALIIVADRPARLETLARAMLGCRRAVFFTTLDEIRLHSFAAPIFCRHERDAGSQLSLGCLV